MLFFFGSIYSEKYHWLASFIGPGIYREQFDWDLSYCLLFTRNITTNGRMYVFIIQCILINVNGNKYACTYGKKKKLRKKVNG